MIRFDHIFYEYSPGHEVISDFSLQIPPGQLVALIGPSGAGKTTLLKMVNRLMDPTKGDIWIEEANIKGQDPVELRRRIGYIIQQIGLFPHMTVWENATLVPRLCKMKEEGWRDRVVDLMNMVDLPHEEFADRYPHQLSGGQQQRVGVVRALASDPPIVLMDEPFSALDPISREQLQEEMLRIQKKYKKTIILVTHDIDEALKLADQICILKNGKIAQFDAPEVIRAEPKDDFVRQFIGEERLCPVRGLREVMISPITIFSHQRLWEAVRRMQRWRVDTLMVIDEDQKFRGVMTLWDMGIHLKKDETLRVEELIDPEYPVLKESADLSEAVAILFNHNRSTLPIVDEEGSLVGVLTRAGLVEMIAGEMIADKRCGWRGGRD